MRRPTADWPDTADQCFDAVLEAGLSPLSPERAQAWFDSCLSVLKVLPTPEQLRRRLRQTAAFLACHPIGTERMSVHAWETTLWWNVIHHIPSPACVL